MPAHPKPSAKPKSPRAMSKPRAPKQHRQAATHKPLAQKAKAVAEKPTPATVSTGQTKGALIQAMLVKGATSKELEAATGWKPHSVRGYLGTLRKAGVNVVSHKVKGEPTVYRLETAEVL